MSETDVKSAFEDADKAKEPEFMEDWRSLKTWKGHRGRSKKILR